MASNDLKPRCPRCGKEMEVRQQVLSADEIPTVVGTAYGCVDCRFVFPKNSKVEEKTTLDSFGSQLMVNAQNFILFIEGVWRYHIPPRLWLHAWHEIKAARLAEVRKAVWELKKVGRVREDKEGRLWIKE